ncbi:Csu type fimbrial protein [Pseudomonas abieticivorans]|uniref:Csu type fimbrial protein n=1 Tax=Pseudomonas abieticivorans TaxID=2931382 RepID=UPI0020C0351B|nr:spore coat U domain-containing protein [Pseudomonas sp. PIA16]
MNACKLAAGVVFSQLLCAPVYALCSVVSTSPAAFGSVSSILVRTTSQSSSTLNAGLSCTGSLLTLLSTNDHFYLTVTSTTGGLVGPTGDVIGYTLYANNSSSYPVARSVQYDFARNGIIDALGLLGGTTPRTVPLYLGTLIGSNVAAGVYTETLSLAWSWNYCSGIGALGICLGRDIGSGNQTLTVNLTVTNDCAITKTDIAFGSAPVVSAFSAVSQTLNLACTKGSSYTVGLDDGKQPVSVGGRRRMIFGSNYLAYDIFKGTSAAVRWGSTGTARRSSSDAEVNPGLGTGTGSQIFSYYAKVYTDQTTPPAGIYADSVILDVAF